MIRCSKTGQHASVLIIITKKMVNRRVTRSSALKDSAVKDNEKEIGGVNQQSTDDGAKLSRSSTTKDIDAEGSDADAESSGSDDDQSSGENAVSDSSEEDNDSEEEYETVMEKSERKYSRGALPTEVAHSDNLPTTKQEADPYDSSDEEDLRNTIGNVPVKWYDDLAHVGYDHEGAPIEKPALRSEIDEFLAKMEDPNYWRTIRDRQTGGEIVLTDEHIATISNIRGGKYPEIGYNPYEPFVQYFTSEVMIHPVSNRPDHKRSFIPSLLDKKKVSKMVHAIKMGWMKPRKPKELKTYDPAELDTRHQNQRSYDLWTDDPDAPSKSQQARLRAHLPAPKMPLPDHSESYNPPNEYLMTDEERKKWEEAEPEERRRDFLPAKFNALRSVPAWDRFIQERFERCLDLYLAPRKRKMKLNVDPKDLLPDLPKPQDLQPFPTTVALKYIGHKAIVRCVSIEPRFGQFMASGSADGTVKIWEIASGCCCLTVPITDDIGSSVTLLNAIAWCPNEKLSLLAVAAGKEILLLNSQVGDKLAIGNTDSTINTLFEGKETQTEEHTLTEWLAESSKQKTMVKIRIKCPSEVKQITFHAKGDYFASVSPAAGNKAVLVHQLSRLKSQAPFSKKKGDVQCVAFHPFRATFFVATQRHVRMYDLSKQQLVKKLMANCRWISSIALHPQGDNLVVGSYDSRTTWFDLDLSAKPYKTFRHHKSAVRAVSFHAHYPLYASVSDDGSAIVYHARVYSDLLQNPLLVPVKVLRGHSSVDDLCVVDCAFHPTQPWLITAGADATLILYT